MGQRGRTWLAIWLGVLVSAGFLWLALRQVDVDELVTAFASVDPLYVLLSAVFLMLGIVFRATRWRLVAGAGPLSHARFHRATTLGVLGNMLLPARLGEVVRVFTLAKLSGGGLARPLASAALDRLFDVMCLMVVAGGLYFVLPRAPLLDRWAATILVLGLGLIGLLAIFAKVRSFGGLWLSQAAARWVQNWKVRPDLFFRELRQETRGLLTGWKSPKLLAVVCLILALDILAIGAQIRAFGLDVPFVSAILLWAFFAAVTMLPSAPGYIGVYQTAAIWALSFFSVSPSSAVALAIVVQATTLAVALILSGRSWWVFMQAALTARQENGP